MKFSNTLRGYQRQWLPADITAGLIVTILLIPQSIAYALLAGLPPVAGLYASLLPLAVYAFLGTSPTLAIGPVAIVSLMTLDALLPFAAAGTAEFAAHATVLAGLTGIWLLVFFAVGLGSWTSFMSHSVISGFTSAAAIVIIINQLKYFTGIDIPHGGGSWFPIAYTLEHWHEAVPMALMMSVASILVLIFWQGYVPKIMSRWKMSSIILPFVTKSGPLIIVVVGILLTQVADLPISTVGDIPAGLPSLQIPSVSDVDWRSLIAPAFVIALIAYLENISIAGAMAMQQSHRISPNQELLALGVANLSAAISQAYPISGSFGRSMVNMSAGARSQVAGLVTLISVIFVCLFASHLFVTLPHAVLAAINTIAVWSLIRWQDGWRAWRFQYSDGLIWLLTFMGVLIWGAETGIVIGIGISLILYLRRTSKPHVVEIGRLGDSERLRSIERHQVETSPELLIVRIDENLYFANSQYLENYIYDRISPKSSVKHVIIVGSAINYIDFCGFESLERILEQLRGQGIQLHFAEFKGPVMDQLGKTNLLTQLQPGQIFMTASDALRTLGHL